MVIRFNYRPVLSLLLLTALAASTNAQNRRNNGNRAPSRPPQGQYGTLRTKATIKGIRGNVFHIASEKNEQWLVRMPDDAKNINVVGKAMPNWLQRGMPVKFYGEFNARGQAKAPIKSLSVFTIPQPERNKPQPNIQFGAFPDKAAVAFDGGDKNDLFSDPNEKKKPQQQADKYIPHTVVGQVKGIRDGRLLVAAGRATIGVQLAENVEIGVEIPDYRWAKIGDEVEVNGWFYNQTRNQVFADRIRIMPANPLGYVPKKEAPKGNAKAKKKAPAKKEEKSPFDF